MIVWVPQSPLIFFHWSKIKKNQNKLVTCMKPYEIPLLGRVNFSTSLDRLSKSAYLQEMIRQGQCFVTFCSTFFSKIKTKNPRTGSENKRDWPKFLQKLVSDRVWFEPPATSGALNVRYFQYFFPGFCRLLARILKFFAYKGRYSDNNFWKFPTLEFLRAKSKKDYFETFDWS